MSVDSEFPALYAVSKMYPAVLKIIEDNLESYSVDVRIDYERWVQYKKEYGEWANKVPSPDASGQSNTWEI
jgi:hypothetical protein